MRTWVVLSSAGGMSKPCRLSIALQTWGTHLGQQCPPTHQEQKGWSGVHACKISAFSQPTSRIVPWPQTRDPLLSWNRDVKLGRPMWSVHQAGWGWSVLTKTGSWASLGQQRRPSCIKTQSWGTERMGRGQKPSLPDKQRNWTP